MNRASLPYWAVLIFAFIGGCATLYVAMDALTKGKIYIRGGTTFLRKKKPIYYWTAITVVCLLTIFFFGMFLYLWGHKY